MAHPFNTFALKLKVHCKDCGMKLEKQLLKIKGVRSVKIDQELGKVVISGKVDPAKILSKFARVGREAELWCEQERPCKDIIGRLKVNDPLNDSDIMAQLEKFSDNSSVKCVEMTTTIKVTFKGESRNGPSEKTVEVNTTNKKNVKKTHDQVLPHDHSHGGGGGLCGASSSCCGGHSATSHNLDHGCYQHGNATSFGPCAQGRNSSYDYHCQYGDCTTSNGSCYANGISPSVGPIWSSDNIPSAPPMPDDYYEAPPSPPSSAMSSDYYQTPPLPPPSAMPDDYYQAPPLPPPSAMPDDYYQAPSSSAITHSYYSVLSDENVNGCTIL
ncbi:hypothetical protein RND71_008136 [Anisodus tanguticus]|uniref:HMA domain-containing protein n=1 Tax=Anisodus tanguticus TaxID=243964 RepID=A0AAE1SP15_9SOLA|nr:hypothetical protein RND71_008136 [Anisodus tanguticus]